MADSERFDPTTFTPYLETPPGLHSARTMEHWFGLMEKVAEAGGNWLVIRDTGSRESLRTNARDLKREYGDHYQFAVHEAINATAQSYRLKLFARLLGDAPAVLLRIPRTPPDLPSPEA